MSELRISPNLFLEQQELNRLKKFLDNDGFRKFTISNSNTFGLIRNDNSPFTNGLVQEDTGLTVKINALSAIDSNGKLISNNAVSQLSIPADSNWYWLKVAYQTTTIETGTFSIDSLGNLVCTSGDAELLNILRGQPNYPSRVTFTNASLNILEYDVLEIIDNNNAVLQGSFTSETGLKLAIVGTFTPGYVPLTSEKYIFQYDSCLLTLVLSNTISPPAHITGIEFIIGKVKNTGASISIEDKRNEIWTTNANYILKNLDLSTNPLIGVEQITYDDSLSTRVQNIVQVAWAFKTISYSINLKLNKITITSGSGGIFKTTNFNSLFINGNFDGWRLYTLSGNHYKIITSTLVAGNIELAMENLDSVDFFSDTNSIISITQSLIITPNAEEIEIICTPDPTSNNLIDDKKVSFLINEAAGDIPLNVYAATGATYNIQYRYKHIKEYSPTYVIQSDTVGYYNESQFDSNGNLIVSPVRIPYISNPSNGFIPLQLNSNAYNNFQNRIDLGDKLGIGTLLLTSSMPLITLTIGSSRQYQLFSDTDTSSSLDTFNLTADMFINLSKVDINGSPCKNGNFFLLHFKQGINLNGFNLRIVTDFVNPSTYTLLKIFTSKDTQFISSSEDGIFIRASFNDYGHWILNNVNESKFVIRDKQTIELYSTPFGGPKNTGFNVNFGTYPSFTTIPSCIITTPNDGITRNYIMAFKADIAVSAGVNSARADFRMVDLATSTQHDYLYFQQDKDTITDIVATSISMHRMAFSILPNTTIAIQAIGYNGNGDQNIHDIKFSMIEI
jgi:hypothetical protein